jgi:hypothetical protein
MIGLFAVSLGCTNSNGPASTATGGTTAKATGGNATGGNSTSSTGGNATGGSSSGTGGSAATGGTTAPATGGSAGSTGSSSCTLPTCLQKIGASCPESGVCATQTNLESESWNTCYANGVTEIVVADASTGNYTLAAKKGGTTCFSTAFNKDNVNAATGSITVKDTSGATVASVKYDDTTSYFIVTCTGGQPINLDPSCGNVWPISAFMGSVCDEGACVP